MTRWASAERCTKGALTFRFTAAADAAGRGRA